MQKEKTRTLKVAISSCPNDTFAFYDFLHNPPPHIVFETDYLDIEKLNAAALLPNSPYDVIKVSFAVAPLLQGRYELLSAGSALGFGVGPVLVAANSHLLDDLKDNLKNEGGAKQHLRLLLPGEYTSAHFLWEYFFEKIFGGINANPLSSIKKKLHVQKEYRVFSKILNAVQRGEADAGVLIHEGRFVYQNLGLFLLQDLGEFWEQQSGLPVPLGGIFASVALEPSLRESLQKHLRQSVVKAMNEKKNNTALYRGNLLPYIKHYAQELEEDVLEKHISYYVNKETVQLSSKGQEAIDFFYCLYNQKMKNGTDQ